MANIFSQRKNKVKDFQEAVRSRILEVKNALVPDGLFENCPKCGRRLLREDLAADHWVCSGCGHHFRIDARQRLDLLLDKNSFEEMAVSLNSRDPLNMPGYKERLEQLEQQGRQEAMICGVGRIGGMSYAVAAMDSRFLMGSMGEAVGEKIVLITEHATKHKLPLLIVTASGGARMQEGILSLMQMARTTAAIKKHHDAGLLYISLLTDPTYGGVSASFATVADIILAEPDALIGFAGPRVIKQTIKEVLPSGFQSAGFLLEKGLIDGLVPRPQLRPTLIRLSLMHGLGGAV